uniref:Uncharacterized protein n=1 Tax=Sphaerodactylus townsendi TaxID=933632 RepID=A0ACB8FSI5_9SAUR
MAMEEFQFAIHQGKLCEDASAHRVVQKRRQLAASTFSRLLSPQDCCGGCRWKTGIQTTTVKAQGLRHHPISLHRSSLWDLLWEEGRLSFHSPRIEQVDPETRLLTLLQSLLGCTSGFSGPGPLRPGPRDPSDIRVRTSYFSADQNRQSHSWKIAPQRRLSRLIKGFCDEKKVLQRIKDDCVTSLLNENVRDPQVFLVSNWDPQSYDFPLLWEKLQSDLLWLKREAFIFSLPSLAAPVLGRKMESVKKKISLIVPLHTRPLYGLLPTMCQGSQARVSRHVLFCEVPLSMLPRVWPG